MLGGLYQLFLLSLVLVLGYAGSAGRQRTSCRDQYVWIADGSVDCKYIETESFWGLHKDPQRWCDYILTDCCETCNRLKDQGVIG